MSHRSDRKYGRACWLLAIFLLPGIGGTAAQEPAVEMSDLSGDPDSPRHHYRLLGAAELEPGEARSVYEIAGRSLEFGYARSALAAAREYRRWQRFNSAPYPSATHGRHMVNNYANAIAAVDYGKQTHDTPLPVGAVLAKDSFAVTSTGGILLGPLFLMEKMPAGFDAELGDWKYSMIMPDGRLIGETGGQGGARVEYCISCHLAVQEQDYLYYVPEGSR